MILSLLRVTSALLVAAVLFSALVLPVRAAPHSEQEIVVREDGGTIHTLLSSTAAGICAAVCLAAVFIIVWKEWEP